jgi:hypothetical protein
VIVEGSPLRWCDASRSRKNRRAHYTFKRHSFVVGCSAELQTVTNENTPLQRNNA